MTAPADGHASRPRLGWSPATGALGRLRLPVPARIWALTLILIAVAATIHVVALQGRPGPQVRFQIPWPVLAFAVAIAELRVVVVHFRRETHSFSLSEFPAVIGMFFLSPGEYLTAVLVGSAAALIVLKIAHEFVGSADGEEEWAFAGAIVALGRTLGLTIIAEGIEEEGQLERLRTLGCEYGQGFLFARPADADAITEFLKDRSGLRAPQPVPAVAGPRPGGRNPQPVIASQRVGTWI